MKHSEVFNILKPAALDLANVWPRHVAAIVYKNKIVSFGTSHMKSHPFQARYSKNDEAIFWHAETNAIYNALRVVDTNILKKCSIYVCRVKNDVRQNMIFGLSQPCTGCQECILDHKIPTLIYTLDGKFGRHRYAVEEESNYR